MKIDIETYGIEPDSEVNHFAMCCAAFELGPHRVQIESVQLHLARAPESRDHKDRHCLVEIELSGGHTVVTQDSDLDMHIAIFRALERAGWMCARQLSREFIDEARLPVPVQQVPKTVEPNRAA